MEIEYLPKVKKFFLSQKRSSELAAYIAALIEDIAEFTPPTAHPKTDRLEGKGLRDVFYCRVYFKKRSDRVYFFCDKGTLFVLMILEDKRRNNLTAGEIEQIKNALEEAKTMLIQNNPNLH